jgi:S1-C subfamily serine protease
VIHRLGLVLVLFGISASAPGGLPDTVERIKDGIVAVGTHLPERTEPLLFHGTGFVVEDGRHVVTNLHVVRDILESGQQDTLAVFFSNGRQIEIRRARVVARDGVHDLCLLRMTGSALPALEIAEATRVREGERYAFTGFPVGTVLGVTPVTHRGIVSAITPIVTPVYRAAKLSSAAIRRMREPYEVYQLDATAYPGNSGSPLYDPDHGRIVGVVNSVLVEDTKESALERPTGISYAIPARHVLDLLRADRAP